MARDEVISRMFPCCVVDQVTTEREFLDSRTSPAHLIILSESCLSPLLSNVRMRSLFGLHVVHIYLVDVCCWSSLTNSFPPAEGAARSL